MKTTPSESIQDAIELSNPKRRSLKVSPASKSRLNKEDSDLDIEDVERELESAERSRSKLSPSVGKMSPDPSYKKSVGSPSDFKLTPSINKPIDSLKQTHR